MSKAGNDNHETVIIHIISVLQNSPTQGTIEQLRKIILKYAEIERNRVYQEILSIPVTIHTSLSDYCAEIRSLATGPYNAL